jgi:hypothetical protein
MKYTSISNVNPGIQVKQCIMPVTVFTCQEHATAACDVGLLNVQGILVEAD